MRLRLVSTPTAADAAAVFAASLGAATAADPSLEDVFVSLARHHAAAA